MDKLLDAIKATVRKPIRLFARGLNKATDGKLHPNAVTFFGLAMHLPIAYFIARGNFIIAAVLLIIFGLFDALDGELARLQKRASNTGMLLDSVTDRMKEVILYGGVVYNLIQTNQEWFAVWAIFAVGGSLLTSYINAWGDVVMAKSKANDHKTNQGFRGGLLRFEVRMFLLVVALFADQLGIFVIVVAVLAWFTAFQRLFMIVKRLQRV